MTPEQIVAMMQLELNELRAELLEDLKYEELRDVHVLKEKIELIKFFINEIENPEE